MPGRSVRWIVSIALGAVLIAAAIALAIVWPFTPNRVRRSLEEASDGTATFEGFRQIYFPLPGCVFRNLSIEGADRPREPHFTARRVVIESSWIDILLLRNRVARVRADGFLVVIPKESSRNARSKDAQATKRSGDEAVIGEFDADGSALEIERAGGAPLRFELPQARLHGVSYRTAIRFTAVIQNPEPPGRIDADGSFGPWREGSAAQTPVSGNFKFTDAKLAYGVILGTLASDGSFSGSLGSIGVHGNLRIPDLSASSGRHSVDLKAAYQAVVNGTNGDITLDRVDSEFLNTRVAWRGRIEGKPGVPGKTATVEISSADARIQDLFVPFLQRRPPFHGSIRFAASVVLVSGNDPFLNRLQLQGSFGVTGGQFANPETQSDINRLSAKASGVSDRQANDDPSQAISNLKGRVDLKRAVATFHGLSFDVPGAGAQLHGTYDLRSERVDLHGTLSTQASLSHDSSGIKSFLLKPFDWAFKKKDAGAAVPVSITGTSEQPSYGVSPRPAGDKHVTDVGRVAQ